MPNEKFMRHWYGASGYVAPKPDERGRVNPEENPHGTDGHCPWCGPSTVVIALGKYGFFVGRCLKCNADGPTADTREDAKAKWNAKTDSTINKGCADDE